MIYASIMMHDPEKKRHYDLNRDSGSSQKPSSTVEPSDKINTETFMNNVLPDSITVPYLIYFYHDYNVQCEYWTKDMKNVIVILLNVVCTCVYNTVQ